MTSTELYLTQALAILVFFVLAPAIILIVARERLQRKAITHVLCEFITPHETGFSKMLQEQNSMVTLTVPSIKGQPPALEKTFPVGKTITVAWPENWPRFIQVAARKGIYRTDTWEPIHRTDGNPWIDPVLAPELLTTLRNEGTATLVIKRAEEEAMRAGYLAPTRKPMRISFDLMFKLVLLIAIGALFYFIIKYGPMLVNILSKLPDALGINV